MTTYCNRWWLIIRKKIGKHKEQWYANKCEEIEILLDRHDDFNLRKKVKELAGTRKTKYRVFLFVDSLEIKTIYTLKK